MTLTRHLFNTFWFVPAVISLFGPLLAALFLIIDDRLQPRQTLFVFHGGTAGASTLLSTIAGSLITVAGLAFSITIVVLQLVSSQYTPRALRGFLQDRVTQVIAGGFFAIFAYFLLVLAAMREPSTTDHGFLPGFHLRLLVCPGDFVTEETVIAENWSPHMADDDIVRAQRQHIAIERERDIAQDARFGVRQLADIALRALMQEETFASSLRCLQPSATLRKQPLCRSSKTFFRPWLLRWQL